MRGVLVAAAEPWPKFRDDPRLRDLILEHGEEVEISPDPDWARMHRMAMAGDLYAVVLRDAGKLAGYCVCSMMWSLAVKTQVVAFAEFVYVKPEHRPEGMKLLLDATQATMREAGAHALVIHHGHMRDGVFPPLRAALSMRVWSKPL